jgi:hypothetical protein
MFLNDRLTRILSKSIWAMGKKLHWVKDAFSRTIVILEEDREVGRLSRRSLLSFDIEATLHQVHLLFDVKGFILHTVDIIDLANNGRVVGTITFSFGKKAEISLATGERYLWRRQNFLMRRWTLTKIDSSEEVLSYQRLRDFFAESGNVEGAAVSEILILTGLFIGRYFLRKKRVARAAAV